MGWPERRWRSRFSAGQNSARSLAELPAGFAASAEMVLSLALSTGLATAADLAATALAPSVKATRQRLVFPVHGELRAGCPDRSPRAPDPAGIGPGARRARARSRWRPYCAASPGALRRSPPPRAADRSAASRGSSTAHRPARARPSAGRRGPPRPARPLSPKRLVPSRAWPTARRPDAARAPRRQNQPARPECRPVGLHCCSPGVGLTVSQLRAPPACRRDLSRSGEMKCPSMVMCSTWPSYR